MTLAQEIAAKRIAIQNLAISEEKKAELLGRLARLRPGNEHSDTCDCGYCESGFADADDQIVDPAILEMKNNFQNPIIPPQIMNSKAFPFVVLGVGIVLVIIGAKMLKKAKAAN